MLFENNQTKIKVFLAQTSVEMDSIKKILLMILESAGMQIISSNSNDNISKILDESDCSIHILGNNYNQNIEEQLTEVRKHYSRNNKFKIFIWQPIEQYISKFDLKQEEFINNVRNNIFRNMIFSNHESPVMFIEDIRSIMHAEKQIAYNIKETEIFFIHNEIDEDSVKGITELLEDIASLQTINIILNSQVDYSELVAQQIKKSELTVIYFKRSVNWALPFTQQIWKKIGGASSGSNILLIGDSGHEQNTKINFEAPNVTFLAISEDLIPLEIKVHYDKISQLEK